MALISLGESKWRMLRRVLSKKRFRYQDCRNQTRNDKEHFDWMIEKGFFSQVGEDLYEVTERSRVAANLGFYEV